MQQWLQKIRTKQLILGGVVFGVVGMVLRMVESALTMSYYTDPNNFALWSKLMMPTEGPPPLQFMVLGLVSAVISGVIVAGFYDLVRESLPKKFIDRVLAFGTMINLVIFMFGYLTIMFLLAVPMNLVLIWSLTGSITIYAVVAALVKFDDQNS